MEVANNVGNGLDMRELNGERRLSARMTPLDSRPAAHLILMPTAQKRWFLQMSTPFSS